MECVDDLDKGFVGSGIGDVGLCCVWIRVLTTSRGVVIMPAMPPADAPVKTSRGRPMSLLPMYARAIFCSCSQNANCRAEKGRSRNSVAL